MSKKLFFNKIEPNKQIFLWKKAYPLIITVIFLSLSIFLVYHHEYWGDEVRSWHLASESNSISELFSIIRVAEGSPSLWYIILYFISHYISGNIEIMKVIHLAASTTTIFLFLKYSPFNLIIRTVFVFGYFPFYEYSIIARNYALGVNIYRFSL